jgi:serine/threonine protein phosphatase PrpC
VSGDLAVSRALGDFMHKRVVGKDMYEQPVSDELDVLEVRRKYSSSEWVVLACDGIWDVLSSEDVAMLVDSMAKFGCLDEGKISSVIVNSAMSRGSTDNLTCLVARLSYLPTTRSEDWSKLYD